MRKINTEISFRVTEPGIAAETEGKSLSESSSSWPVKKFAGSGAQTAGRDTQESKMAMENSPFIDGFPIKTSI